MGQSALSCFGSASPKECTSKRALIQSSYLSIETGDQDANFDMTIQETNRHSDIFTENYNLKNIVSTSYCIGYFDYSMNILKLLVKLLLTKIIICIQKK